MANYFLYQNIYNDQDRFTTVKEESEVKEENRFTGDLFLLCYKKLAGLHIETQKYQNQLCNLFVTSKNETTNSPIHKFKVLHKSQGAF